MSTAQPFVNGCTVRLSRWGGSAARDVVLGTFSCHWAAVAAMVRLRQPDFRSTGGDNAEDLAEEQRMRERLAAERVRRLKPEPPNHGKWCCCPTCNLTRGPIRFGVEDDCDPWA